MKIFAVIMSVFTAGLMGPLGAFIFASSVSSVSGGPDFVKDTIDKVEKAIVDTLKPLIGEKAANALAVVMTMMMMTTASSGGMGAYKYLTDYGGLEQFLTKTCGIKPMVASIISMSVQMVIEIVAMVVMTILSAGAAGALLAGYITAKVAQVMAKVTQAVIKVLTRIAEIVAKISQKIADAIVKTLNKLISFAERMAKLADDIMAQSKIVLEAQKAAATTARVEKEALSAVGRGEHVASDVIIRTAEEAGRAAKIAKEAVGELQKLTNAFGKIYKTQAVISDILQGVSSAVTMSSEISQAKYAKIKANYDAEIAILEGLIVGLKQILKTLQEAMEGTGQNMADIGQLLSKMASDRSQTLDAIVQA